MNVSNKAVSVDNSRRRLLLRKFPTTKEAPPLLLLATEGSCPTPSKQQQQQQQPIQHPSSRFRAPRTHHKRTSSMTLKRAPKLAFMHRWLALLLLSLLPFSRSSPSSTSPATVLLPSSSSASSPSATTETTLSTLVLSTSNIESATSNTTSNTATTNSSAGVSPVDQVKRRKKKEYLRKKSRSTTNIRGLERHYHHRNHHRHHCDDRDEKECRRRKNGYSTYPLSKNSKGSNGVRSTSLSDVWLCLLCATGWCVWMLNSFFKDSDQLLRYAQRDTKLVRGHVLQVSIEDDELGTGIPTYHAVIDYCTDQPIKKTISKNGEVVVVHTTEPVQVRKQFQTQHLLQQGFANVELLVLPDEPTLSVLKDDWEREVQEEEDASISYYDYFTSTTTATIAGTSDKGSGTASCNNNPSLSGPGNTSVSSNNNIPISPTSHTNKTPNMTNTRNALGRTGRGGPGPGGWAPPTTSLTNRYHIRKRDPDSLESWGKRLSFGISLFLIVASLLGAVETIGSLRTPQEQLDGWISLVIGAVLIWPTAVGVLKVINMCYKAGRVPTEKSGIIINKNDQNKTSGGSKTTHHNNTHNNNAHTTALTSSLHNTGAHTNHKKRNRHTTTSTTTTGTKTPSPRQQQLEEEQQELHKMDSYYSNYSYYMSKSSPHDDAYAQARAQQEAAQTLTAHHSYDQASGYYYVNLYPPKKNSPKSKRRGLKGSKSSDVSEVIDEGLSEDNSSFSSISGNSGMGMDQTYSDIERQTRKQAKQQQQHANANDSPLSSASM